MANRKKKKKQPKVVGVKVHKVTELAPEHHIILNELEVKGAVEMPGLEVHEELPSQEADPVECAEPRYDGPPIREELPPTPPSVPAKPAKGRWHNFLKNMGWA